MEQNSVTRIAKKAGREYITPEDVSQAIAEGAEKSAVQAAVLEVIGGIALYGAEDSSLCAYIAARYDERKAKAGKKKARK
jgi:hypothetical protein